MAKVLACASRCGGLRRNLSNALVVAGIYFTIAPWRLRDLLEFATANETRVRISSGVRLAFALFIVLLGLTAFRGM